MDKMNTLDWIAYVLVIVGGLNWGLIGLLNFDLIGVIFGLMGIISRIIFTLVGVAAVYLIVSSKRLSDGGVS